MTVAQLEIIPMAWEPRKKSVYYYRKKKIAGRVVSLYVGAGEVGEVAADADAQRRALDAEEKSERDATREQIRTVEQLAGQFQHQVKEAVAEVLSQVGCYQHHREWRPMGDNQIAVADMETALTLPIELSTRVRSSASSMLAAVDTSPSVSGRIHKALEDMRMELGYADALPAEKLLIEDVCLSWLRFFLVSQLHDQQCGNQDDYSPAWVEHFERRLSVAHNRYLRSIETLSRVKRLLVQVQINIA